MRKIDFIIYEQDDSFGLPKYAAVISDNGVYMRTTVIIDGDTLQQTIDRLRSHIRTTYGQEVLDSEIKVKFLDNPHALICDDPKIYVH